MSETKRLIRVQYAVYQTKEAALADGWPDAEYGCWQLAPWSPKLVRGWIALEFDEPDDAE